MTNHELAALVAAVVLAGLHVEARRLRFLDGVPRSWLLSAAGGISVAYVFVHLLPEVAEGQEALAEAAEGVLPAVERHAYVLALVGMAVFYGVERLAAESRRRNAPVPAGGGGAPPADEGTDVGTFAVSIVSFTVYNAVIGYLLVGRAGNEGAGSLAVFTLAIGMHFVVNDYGLREHHRRRYRHLGRWLLGAAVLLGWGIGVVTEVSEAAIAVLIAFLGGGVVLNVLKEELPEERESRYWAFFAGASAYTALLLAT